MTTSRRQLVLEYLESREMLSVDGLASDHLPHRLRGVSSLGPSQGSAIQVSPISASAPVTEAISDALLDRLSPDRAGGTRGTAADLGVIEQSVSLRGRVGRLDQADTFRFELERSAEVELNLDGFWGNTNLALYDADGQLVAASTRGFRSERLTESLRAGVYYGRVSSADLRFAFYRLSVSATDTVIPEVPATRPDRGNPSPPPTSTPVTDSPPPANTPPSTAPPATAPSNPPPVRPPEAPTSPAEPQPLQDVPYYGGTNEWNLNAINAPEAWAAGATGEGITVAVVDTGVDWRHTDLASNMWTNSDEISGDGIDNDGNGFVDDVFGWNFANDNSDVSDTVGHGTHVAGTIAALSNGFGATGVAPDATIMPVRVLGDNGSGSTVDVAAGIRYAVQNGADVINLSLGGGFSYAVQSALNDALASDVLVVAAAGNQSASIASYPAAHSANLSNVISVGAYDRQGTRAGFSNLPGSGVVQVDAPGVGIYSALVGNRFGRMSGTSMAAPHVAGLAALALSRQPDLSASELRFRLVSGATQAIANTNTEGVNASTTLAVSSTTNLMASPGAIFAENSESDHQMNSPDDVISMLATDVQLARNADPLRLSARSTASHDLPLPREIKIGFEQVDQILSSDLDRFPLNSTPV